MRFEKFLTAPETFVFSQGIAPLVYDELKKNPDVRVDREFKESLGEYFRYRCLFHLQLEAEAKRVSRHLSGAGIEHLFIKGFPLSFLLYEHPALRVFSDIDILVLKEKAGDVKRVLAELAYGFPPGVSGDYISQEFVAEKNVGGIPVAFDFHVALSSAIYFKDVFSFEELSSGAIAVGGSFEPCVRTLSWPHALALAAMHLMGHHASEMRLIWLYDIHLMAERMSGEEFAAFAELAVSKRIASVCLYTMRQSEKAFGTRIPESVVRLWEQVAPSEKEAALYLKGRTPLDEFWISWKLIPGFSRKTKYLKELLFPSEEYMRLRYPALGHVALPWLYLRRVWKGMRKWLSV